MTNFVAESTESTESLVLFDYGSAAGDRAGS
jgi:hypothetical protein